jgi:hypothetical protein
VAKAKIKQPSKAVLAARARRESRKVTAKARVDWYIKEVSDHVELTVEERTRVATSFLKDQVVRNISIPVTKGVGPRGGKVVTDRSKPGEFPRADTTQLMKSIFEDYSQTSKGVYDGFVGTPLDYGLILETSERLDRSFLVRTFNENHEEIKRILTGPIRDP